MVIRCMFKSYTPTLEAVPGMSSGEGQLLDASLHSSPWWLLSSVRPRATTYSIQYGQSVDDGSEVSPVFLSRMVLEAERRGGAHCHRLRYLGAFLPCSLPSGMWLHD